MPILLHIYKNRKFLYCRTNTALISTLADRVSKLVVFVFIRKHTAILARLCQPVEVISTFKIVQYDDIY